MKDLFPKDFFNKDIQYSKFKLDINYRKEGKYMSNLVNNSTARIDEVVYGVDMSGIKGYYATVKIKTDATTDVGGNKQIFAASTNNIMSSN